MASQHRTSCGQMCLAMAVTATFCLMGPSMNSATTELMLEHIAVLLRME